MDGNQILSQPGRLYGDFGPPMRSPGYGLTMRSREYWDLCQVARDAARLISLDSHRKMLMDESDYWRDRAEWAEYEEWLAGGDDEVAPFRSIFAR